MVSLTILKYLVNFILPKIINECDLNSQHSLINCPLEKIFPRFNIIFLRVGWQLFAGQHEDQQTMTSGAFASFIPQ